MQKWKKKFFLTFFSALILWGLGFYLYHYKLNVKISESTVEDFRYDLNKKQNSLSFFVNNLTSKIKENQDFNFVFQEAVKISNEKNIDLFVYKNDTVWVWTSNKTTISKTNPNQLFSSEIVQLSNGWYSMYHTSYQEYEIIGSFLIKNQFSIENQDLKNHFSESFLYTSHADILVDEQTGFPIYNAENDYLFSLLPTHQYERNDKVEITVFFLYLSAILLFLQNVISSFQILLIKKPYLLIIFPFSLIGLRFLSLKNDWFTIFSKFELFNPELFATSEYVPSLGDLIINVALFYFMVHFMIKRTRNWFVNSKKISFSLFILPLFVFSFFVANQINELIYSLIFDSKISLDLTYFFDLNFYSFLSITIIGTSFYAYFKFCQYCVIQLKKAGFEWNKLSFIWVILSMLYIVFDQWKFQHSILTSLWPVLLSGFLIWFEFKERKYLYTHVIILIAVVSFYTAFILKEYSEKKEMEIRQIYAEQIATDEDPLTEIEYDGIEKKLKRDKYLYNILTSEIQDPLFFETLEDYYFAKLKTKFELNFHLYDEQKRKFREKSEYISFDHDYFTGIQLKFGKVSSINPNIYYVKNYYDKLSYIVNFPIEVEDSTHGYLAIEMRSKKFPKDIGLPSLLLEKESNSAINFKNYSIAKYVEGSLVSYKGDYNYTFTKPKWANSKDEFTERNKYSHYLYFIDDENLTIISKEKISISALFTSFSYILLLFGSLLTIPLFYQKIQKGKSIFKGRKLNFKIQSVMIGLILVSLITFGIVSGSYVVEQYNISSKSFMQEKTKSVQTELSQKLGNESSLEYFDQSYLQYLLKKFSKVFVTDINLYDINGKLIASSQPKIYSKGLVSKLMNVSAFQALNQENKNECIHNETIGELNYLSSYVPFFNNDGQLLAYLNLQYITKQEDLENQISGFLLTIINILVLMLAISTILAIFISNRLTLPLKYIQESLKKVQLGAKNTPIQYKSNDEIGDLVLEYNKKVEELQKNAEQLAKTERESAWREMAKQVAHEIKNPLTPMKLSIQHLKRSVNLADEESKVKLDRVTESLIEQIEALTNIANEFSNFAKMPKPIEEKIHLDEVVKNAYSVFNELGNNEINYQNLCNGKTEIWADKNLLIRVFNNLIKNAIQSIPVDRVGEVSIILKENDNRYLVEIKDNGKGISKDEQKNIFVPYFTTKSTGTGLGLAMSKQIVESMNGKIWFESEKDTGTSFFVSIPFYVAKN